MKNRPLVGAVFATALGGLVAFEGMELTAYKDIVGVPTICAGTTAGVKMGDTKTAKQCWEIAGEEYRKYESTVLRVIQKPMKAQHQRAFTYLAVNIGSAGFAGSTVARKFNAGDTAGACHAIRMWNKVTVNGRKVVSKGLDNRRKAEEALCLYGIEPPSYSY